MHIILPAGFVLSDKNFRRAGMDYLDQAVLVQHVDWSAFQEYCTEQHRRIVLLSTKAATPYTEFCFKDDDVLMLGRESSGVPESVHQQVHSRVVIPMVEGARSLNIAVSGAMVLGEALRQSIN